MLYWTHWGTPAVTTFLAAFVEGVEALTIVLAIGITRGWYSVLTGVTAALVLLICLVIAFGPLLMHIPIPLPWLQFTLGLFLLFFGLTWLRKAILRATGYIPLHDEALIYKQHTQQWSITTTDKHKWNIIAFATCFKTVLVEGIEVILIVIAISTAQASLLPSSLGALTALIVVIFLGFLLHSPLTKVPENNLKLSVGVLLSSFGIFWIGEGCKHHWPGGDLTILALIGIISITTFFIITMIKNKRIT